MSFVANRDRGTWSSPNDFLFACISNAFRIDTADMTILVPAIVFGGVSSILGVIICALLFAIPVIFIQSFLGQFSSSGFISALRISPLFKGLGYAGLAINLLYLPFYSLFTAVPLVYVFHSLQPTLPWSCKGAQSWLRNETYYKTHCEIFNKSVDNEFVLFFDQMHTPSAEFFTHHVEGSLWLLGCISIVWAAVAFILSNKTDRIGKILRYSTIALITLLVVIFIRMSCLPGVIQGLADNFLTYTGIESWRLWMYSIPALMFTSFGPGWASILSMASYNKFRTNISKYSWMIFLSQMGVLLMTVFLNQFSDYHLTQNKPVVLEYVTRAELVPFVTIPSSLADQELGHLWTWLYLCMLIAGCFSLLLVQVFSVLTAVLDEFEKVRFHKGKAIYGTAGIMALISGIFSKNGGFLVAKIISNFILISHVVLSLLLLVAAVWVYGKDRFKLDIEFMSNQVFALWKVYILKFITPLFYIPFLIWGILFASDLLGNHQIKMHSTLSFILICLVLLEVPAYWFFKIFQTRGAIGQRVKRCSQPSDWYPVEPLDKDRYEEIEINQGTSQPLTTFLF